MDTITVICLVPRVGPGVVLSKGDEWEVTPLKAARLIAAGQVKLKDKADASKLPAIEIPQPAVAEAAPEAAADEFDESDAINADDSTGEDQTGLAKAKAKRKAKADKEAASDK
ncbi:MAG: hypothetical protein E6Q76_12765 [Rhizobium sp.]|nr:MAG: hypothetical protein E6Q76_12765 [Rhizobium sp.]